MSLTYSNRLRADELRYEVGVRGTRAPDTATVDQLRRVLARLLREEEQGTAHDDALLPVQVDEELSVMDAKVQELGAAVALLELEPDDSTAARVRALAAHCNRRLSRLLEHSEAGERNRVKALLLDLKGHVRTVRGVHEGPLYQASSVLSISTVSGTSVSSAASSTATSASQSDTASSASTCPSVKPPSTRDSSSSKKSNKSKSNSGSEPSSRTKIDFSKWNVTFSGEGEASVLSFVMDIEEKAESQGIAHKYLIRGAPEFFTGRAKTWYRSVKHQVNSWNELKMFLRTEFLPMGYYDNLWEEVRNRKQGENEQIGAYIANMLMLFERLSEMGPVKEEIKLNIILKNLAPFYLDGLKLTTVMSVSHLKNLGRELEMAKFRVERYDKSRTKCPPMEPEFAYQCKGRAKAAVNALEPDPEVAASAPHNPQKNRPSFTCWRCDRAGHGYRDCRAKGDFEMFCWGCGKKGAMRVTCPVCKARKETKERSSSGESWRDEKFDPSKEETEFKATKNQW
ncbi:hypothetical protein FOCC_FOCC002221 [Frankliniella occidentalis]|nr:hypothetical protein FOCC_FOCC002221 [Frankliniella occidentalis]